MKYVNLFLRKTQGNIFNEKEDLKYYFITVIDNIEIFERRNVKDKVEVEISDYILSDAKGVIERGEIEVGDYLKLLATKSADVQKANNYVVAREKFSINNMDSLCTRLKTHYGLSLEKSDLASVVKEFSLKDSVFIFRLEDK